MNDEFVVAIFAPILAISTTVLILAVREVPINTIWGELLIILGLFWATYGLDSLKSRTASPE